MVLLASAKRKREMGEIIPITAEEHDACSRHSINLDRVKPLPIPTYVKREIEQEISERRYPAPPRQRRARTPSGHHFETRLPMGVLAENMATHPQKKQAPRTCGCAARGKHRLTCSQTAPVPAMAEAVQKMAVEAYESIEKVAPDPVVVRKTLSLSWLDRLLALVVGKIDVVIQVRSE